MLLQKRITKNITAPYSEYSQRSPFGQSTGGCSGTMAGTDGAGAFASVTLERRLVMTVAALGTVGGPSTTYVRGFNGQTMTTKFKRIRFGASPY